MKEMRATVAGRVLRVDEDRFTFKSGAEYRGHVVRLLDVDELVDVRVEEGGVVGVPAVGDDVAYRVRVEAALAFGRPGDPELRVKAVEPVAAAGNGQAPKGRGAAKVPF